MRVYAGVYRPADGATAGRTALEEEHDLIRAVAGRTRTLVVSDRSAGVIHRLALPRPASLMVQLTRDAASGGNRNGIRHVHARPLKEGDVVEVDGIRTTSVARTLLDLACGLDQRQAVAAIDDALHRKLVDPVALGAALAGVDRRLGVQAARRAFAMADGLAESVGESFLRVVMKELGLPEPNLQVVVRGPRGEFIARVDLAYPDLGVIIEFDGETKYTALLRPGQSASHVVIAEKDRENRLLECGYIVIRVVWKELIVRSSSRPGFSERSHGGVGRRPPA